jgi:hypothetical protein
VQVKKRWLLKQKMSTISSFLTMYSVGINTQEPLAIALHLQMVDKKWLTAASDLLLLCIHDNHLGRRKQKERKRKTEFKNSFIVVRL